MKTERLGLSALQFLFAGFVIGYATHNIGIGLGVTLFGWGILIAANT